MGFSLGTGELIASETYDSAAVIETDVLSYAVEVQTHAEDTVQVEIYRSGFNTAPEPVISRSGDTVNITQKGSHIGINFGGGRVLIYVPESSVMDYSLKTVSGSIKLYGTGKSVSLKTVSGSIKDFAGGETLTASTVSGSIRAFAPFVTVDCSTTSGSVRARADGQTERVDLSTVSGSTRLSLASDVTGYSMTHSSVSGSVKDTYHNQDFAKSGNGSWGDNSLQIRMKTTSGSIRLEDWND